MLLMRSNCAQLLSYSISNSSNHRSTWIFLDLPISICWIQVPIGVLGLVNSIVGSFSNCLMKSGRLVMLLWDVVVWREDGLCAVVSIFIFCCDGGGILLRLFLFPVDVPAALISIHSPLVWPSLWAGELRIWISLDFITCWGTRIAGLLEIVWNFIFCSLRKCTWISKSPWLVCNDDRSVLFTDSIKDALLDSYEESDIKDSSNVAKLSFSLEISILNGSFWCLAKL